MGSGDGPVDDLDQRTITIQRRRGRIGDKPAAPPDGIAKIGVGEASK
jgi:hypothetical protein